jgi:hypothetical protein
MAHPAVARGRVLLPRPSIACSSLAALAAVLLLSSPFTASAAAYPGREFRPGDFLPSARRVQYHGVRD